MFIQPFNMISTKSILVHFNCPNCGTEINETLYDIPTPNFSAEKDTHSATQNINYEDIECQNCHKSVSFCISASICGGEISCDDIDVENVHIETDEYSDDYFDAIIRNTNYFDTFESQMNQIEEMLKIELPDEKQENTLNKLLFANVITCLETYLSDALINLVMNNNEYLRNFVKSYNKYDSISIKFSNIYEQFEKIKSIVKDDLAELIYHNLPKLKNIYALTLNVKFPNFSEISKKISIRHDIVHRNGKDKNNKDQIITKEEVKTTYSLIYDFVMAIDEQLDRTIK
ncbi:MAG: hypothetical protein PUG55_05885 [Bacillales bacterium]|nr:hypothetical protein [Bacillales bacterium]